MGLLLGLSDLYDDGLQLQECQPVVTPAVTLQPRCVNVCVGLRVVV